MNPEEALMLILRDLRRDAPRAAGTQAPAGGGLIGRVAEWIRLAGRAYWAAWSRHVESLAPRTDSRARMGTPRPVPRLRPPMHRAKRRRRHPRRE